MGKLITLVKSPAALPPGLLAARWRDQLLPALVALPGIGSHLVRAVHHHAVPSGIRAEDGVGGGHWAGVGTYYFDDAALVDRLPTDPAFLALFARHGEVIEEAVHLPIDEILIYDRDTAPLPLKMFAFFKRRPDFTRAQSLHYYRTTHAEVGEGIVRGRIGRFVQNHVRLDFRSIDPRYDFDAGPEIWFRSMEIALDLFGDREAMEILSADEERFVIRSELINLLTDEQEVFVRADAIA
ncbi:MAG: hypothetical protein JWO65_1935 [Sphingomonas bacterium]|nr:hypothetical protein [Sphingomonas bacterium]